MSDTPGSMYSRLREQESASLDEAATELARDCTRTVDLLSATCALLNRRARYFSMAGEHGSAFDVEGIEFVDALDERLLECIDRVLTARAASEIPVGAGQRLQGILPGLPTLSPHPVGYMIVFLLVKAFTLFEQGTKDLDRAERAGLEEALLARMREWVAGFVKTRRTPVVRHMSDVSREYSVIARLSCACGKTGFALERQALKTLPGGRCVDCLSVKCPACGAQREIEFALPHFGDLSQMIRPPKGGGDPV